MQLSLAPKFRSQSKINLYYDAAEILSETYCLVYIWYVHEVGGSGALSQWSRTYSKKYLWMTSS